MTCIKESVTVDGITAKINVFPHKDSYVPQHSHKYDHLSIIATGGARVWCDGVLLGDYMAPSSLNIKAGVRHLFYTLEDNTTIYCIHHLHADEIEIIESHLIEVA